jgi:hypothetical protein
MNDRSKASSGQPAGNLGEGEEAFVPSPSLVWEGEDSCLPSPSLAGGGEKGRFLFP